MFISYCQSFCFGDMEVTLRAAPGRGHQVAYMFLDVILSGQSPYVDEEHHIDQAAALHPEKFCANARRHAVSRRYPSYPRMVNSEVTPWMIVRFWGNRRSVML
jgi:hypothetical protein